jgi:hypothetical protein
MRRLKLIILILPLIAAALRCTRHEEQLDIVNVSNTRGYSEYPAIAADSRGYFYVVWDEQFITQESLFIYLAVRDPSGEWTAPEKIFELQWATFPDIEIDQHNTIHVIWRDTDEHGWGEVLYTKKKTGCMWAEPETISVYGMSCNPELAVDNFGNVHLVWLEWPTYTHKYIFYAKKSSAGTWSMPLEISIGEAFSRGEPQIAVTPTGDVHIVWDELETDAGTRLILHCMSDGDNSFTQPKAIHYEDFYLDSQTNPAIAVDQSGTAHVVWNARGEVFYTFKEPNADWQTPAQISSTEYLSMRPSIAVDAGGNLTVVWIEGDDRLANVSRKADGDWGHINTYIISPLAFPSPELAISTNSIGVVYSQPIEFDPAGKDNTEIFFLEVPMY